MLNSHPVILLALAEDAEAGALTPLCQCGWGGWGARQCCRWWSCWGRRPWCCPSTPPLCPSPPAPPGSPPLSQRRGPTHMVSVEGRSSALPEQSYIIYIFIKCIKCMKRIIIFVQQIYDDGNNSHNLILNLIHILMFTLHVHCIMNNIILVCWWTIKMFDVKNVGGEIEWVKKRWSPNIKEGNLTRADLSLWFKWTQARPRRKIKI